METKFDKVKVFFRDVIMVLVDWFVTNVENILIRATPLLSPLPSAFAIIHALGKAGWGYPVLMGAIIEAMGMGAGWLIGYIADHNKKYERKQIRPSIGYSLFGFYLFLAIAIVGGYETIPTVINWWYRETGGDEVIKSFVPLLFPGLTVVGAMIIALREYMKRVEQEAKEIKEKEEKKEEEDRTLEAEERKENVSFELEKKRRKFDLELEMARAEHEHKLEIERQKVTAKLSKPTVQTVSNERPNGQGMSNGVQSNGQAKGGVEEVLDLYRQNPLASLRYVGRTVGRSPQTVSNWLDELEQAGKIHRNGGGVEVRE